MSQKTRQKKKKRNIWNQGVHVIFVQQVIDYLHTTQHKDIRNKQKHMHTKSNKQKQTQPCTSIIFVVPQLFTRPKNFERSFVYCNIFFQTSPVSKTTLLQRWNSNNRTGLFPQYFYTVKFELISSHQLHFSSCLSMVALSRVNYKDTEHVLW